MIALLWLLVWEVSLLPIVTAPLPEQGVGLLLLCLLILGLGVGWYGCVGLEINRVAWLVTIGGYLARTSYYLTVAGPFADALGMPLSDVMMLTLWLGIPLAWSLHPLLAGAEWGIGRVRGQQESTRRVRRRRLRR